VNVLVIFTYGYSFKTWEDSGTTSREISLYKKLHDDYNINFIFLTFGGKEDEEFDYEDCGIKILPIYTRIKFYNSKLINYFTSFFIPFYLKKDLENIDVVKQNQLLGSWVALIIKLLYKKPIFIRTGYDMYKFSLEESKKNYIKYLYRLLTKYTIMFSDLYTVTSESDRSFLKNTFKLKKEIFLRRNWVLKTDYKNFDDRNDKKVLSIGRLEKQKDFKYLIESIKNTSFQLDIVGEGSMKEMLINEGREKNVKLNFINNMQNKKLLEIIKNYKYYISASSYEGNPKSLLEALSSGCLVIATDIENHKELIKNNISGILYSKSKNELPEIIENLGENRNSEKLMSENAFKSINDQFSIENIVLEEVNDYRNLSIDDK
tara:strand:+ start:310 stop:1437 length:1128 start_codon:yes stop_codon:yes gene_type:complete